MKVNLQKLQIAMANACVNKSELADNAGISRITVSSYFSRKRNPSLKTVGKIAKALNVPVTEIIETE